MLDHAARDADVREMAHGAAAVERLWDACQIPDYRKIAPAAHAELVTTLFGFLMKKGRIPDAWFAAQVDQADRIDGDIDTLSGRIAQIRTWTFVANRPDWLADPEHWQGITREVENKLSDALHERLTERFVDRRTSVLMRRLRENTVLNTEIGKTGEVTVEGHVIGRLDGFTFAPDAAEAGSDAKALQATALKALAGEIDARAEKLAAAPDDQFVLTSDGTIRWTGDAVAKLVAAEDALHPRLRIISDERLSGAPREAVQARLDLWLKTHIEKLLGPLFDLAKAEDITGIARGIAFQLIEALGVLERAKIAAEMKDLDQPSRASLRKYGVRFGAYHIYLPALLKPAARALASLLWAEKQDNVDMSALSGAQHLAGSGRTSFPVDKAASPRCLSRARLSAMRRTRGAGRYSGAARRSDPPGAVLARNLAGRKARRRVRRPRFCRDAGDDLADGLGRRGFRLDPARARLSHGAARAAAAETGRGRSARGGDSAAAEAAPAAETAPAAEAVPAEAVTETSPQAASEVVAQHAAAEAVVGGDPVRPERRCRGGPRCFAGFRRCRVGIVGVEAARRRLCASRRSGAAGSRRSSSRAGGLDRSRSRRSAAGSGRCATAAADVRSRRSRAAAPHAVAAPEMVEVWRPGGRSEERRPRHDRNRHRHQDRPVEGAQPVAAAAGEAAEPAKGERHRRGRRERHSEFRKPRPDAPDRGASRRRPPRALRFANRARSGRVRRASALPARAGITTRAGTRANLPAGATRAGATRADAIATRAAGTAGPRTGTMRPARPRASASARSIPIRRSPSWRR